MTFLRADSFWLRVVCLLLCIPSGGALLAKVYGLASLQFVTLAIFLPGVVVLIVLWRWARRHGREYPANAVVIGFWGGLLGTLAYDVARLPFLLLGQRVFAPINVYGVWLAEAATSSRFSDVLGWAYHFSNGITFGLMYALFMRRQHWLWAILWGLVLETIAVLSPFAPIFNLSGNTYALGIAYLGHVAYGLPLGWLVYRWDNVRHWLDQAPPWLSWAGLGLAALLVAVPLVWPAWVARDGRTAPGTLRLEGDRLNPGWVRLERGDSVRLWNPESQPAVVIVKTSDTVVPLAAGGQEPLSFEKTGIYQIYVETEGRTHSSFAIVEPVEELER
ncbi:MAG: hypothetical protein L0332_02435 [Chloroflexi bacterium]|nr:hypothetical protein [Chloroflexota bacterium]MCI0577504.1 hypothetical protein [Chloroflexota bacterium]MCI0645658.1 hypothetical protein [Chloroflexota bacterium]MCI0725570.1 hypothetical protein [Chloroflexota bacterium]